MLFKQEQTTQTSSLKNNKTLTLIFPSVFTSNKEDANTTIKFFIKIFYLLILIFFIIIFEPLLNIFYFLLS